MNNLLRNKSVLNYAILAFAIFLIFSFIPSVSADISLDPFADRKIYEPVITEDMPDFIKTDFNEDYGVIRLSKTFLWITTDKIAEYSLTKNTDQCLIDCEAEGKAVLYVDGLLFENVSFQDKNRKEIDVEYKNLFILSDENYTVEVPDRIEEVCKMFDSKTNLPSKEGDWLYCYNQTLTYKNETKIRSIWKEYKGDVLSAGEYSWKLEGRKNINQDVDWITEKNGKEFSEWAWWNTTWERKKQIDITGSNATLINFTVYINVSYDTEMQADFDDIRFANSSESGELKYELDLKSDSSYAAYWVNIPVLNPGNQNTTIYMYYNNTGAASTQDHIRAWDPNYKSVLHFSETAGGVSYDSIGNFNFTLQGGYTQAQASSWFGTAIDTNSGNGVPIVSTSYFSTAAGTLEVYAYSNDDGYLFDTLNGDPKYRGYLQTAGTTTLDFTINNDADRVINRGDTMMNPIGYIAVEHDATLKYAFSNGVFNLSIGNAGTPTNANGKLFTDWNNAAPLDIVVTEWRYSSVKRSAEWISRSYQNTNLSNIVFGPTLNVNGMILNLISPANGAAYSYSTINFTCNASEDNPGLLNLTLIIDDVDNYTIYNSTLYENITLSINVSVSEGTHNFSCRSTDGTGIGEPITKSRDFSVDTIFPVINIITPSGELYMPPYNFFDLNYTANDTSLSNCSYSYNGALNISYNCNVNFTGINFTHLGENTITLYANDTVGNINSSTRTFYVEPTMARCNDTFTKLFLNYSFKDESTNLNMNASIDTATFYYWYDDQNVNTTYNYINNTENYNYTFCVYPNWTNNLSMSYNIKYSSDTFSATSYPIRTYAISSTAYTNTTINAITLYLLSSADGIYTTIQTMTSGGVTIPGVLLQVERQIGGLSTLISQGTTDGSGTSTFWVNPNFEHTITATKSGYTSVTVSIYPTSSTYTITMGGGAEDGMYYSYYREGLTYSLYPKSGMLETGKYNFSFAARYINPNGLVLQNCSLELLNSSRDTVNVTYDLVNSTYCRPVFSAFYFDNSKYGRYSVQINDTWIILESDAHWINWAPNYTGIGLMDFINSATFMCNQYNASGDCISSDWGDNPETNDFSRIVFFFLIMAIILSAINFYSSYDTLYPGASIYILWGAIILGSLANGIRGPGFFYLDVVNLNTMVAGVDGRPFAAIMNNWIVAIYTSMIVFSVTMMNIRRNEGG